MDFRKKLPFKSYGVKKPICKCVRAHRQPMLLQRLATGATGVKQARYRRGPTRTGQRGTRTRMRSFVLICHTHEYIHSMSIIITSK